MLCNSVIGALALVLCANAATAAESYPLKIPAPGGEVILLDARTKEDYDAYRFAAIRRVDNTLYISGVIMGRRNGEGRDVAAFKVQVRRGLERLKQILASAGASFQDVAMINSFHVWQGPNFTGTRDEQFDAFESVIDEFMKPPYPAWTAVGTSGLLADSGIVEVQLIARLPNTAAK